MSALELLGLILGLSILGGVVAVALWFSGLTRSDHRAHVGKLDAVFSQVGGSGPLRYFEGGSYDHPMVGSLPIFPTLRGRWGEFEITVDVESRYSGGTMTRFVHNLLRVRIRPPADRTFRVADMTKAGREGLDVQLDSDHLVVVDTRSRRGQVFHVWYAFPETAQELVSYLDHVHALAKAMAGVT